MKDDFTGHNILVTGGTGFVGSHLVEDLCDLGNRVTVTTLRDDPYSYFRDKNLSLRSIVTQLDIINFEQLFDLVTKSGFDYIFHLAAQPLVNVAYINPRRTLNSNINGTINILECARLTGTIKGVIVASSDKAYGKMVKVDSQYIEEDPLLGDHPYEVSKSAADLICTMYFKTYGIPVVITRFGNIYGEGDLNFSRIIPDIMKSQITKTKLQLRSDGTFVRDYLYVKDVTSGYIRLAKAIQQVTGEAFNFGSDDTYSVIDLIKIIDKSLRTSTEYITLNNAINEIPYQSLNYQKIQKFIGWEPKHSVKKTINDIKEWYVRYFKKLKSV